MNLKIFPRKNGENVMKIFWNFFEKITKFFFGKKKIRKKFFRNFFVLNTIWKWFLCRKMFWKKFIFKKFPRKKRCENHEKWAKNHVFSTFNIVSISFFHKTDMMFVILAEFHLWGTYGDVSGPFTLENQYFPVDFHWKSMKNQWKSMFFQHSENTK